MRGKICASVLKTVPSNGRKSVGENSKYKYFRVSAYFTSIHGILSSWDFGWSLSYQPKTLHVVSPRRRDLIGIVERRITLSILEDPVLLKCLEDLPAPFPVDGVVRDAVHHEKAFHRLRGV